ncbi:hypothetical protein TVAG_157480 [Trichomonas vaginalis G3]|uniref:Uncharacterized protein n=1 Tax=Trichomonas vaginalis (strain ATCC PRA-98 / G3) TaxID=412133 RepID=A2E9M0_TRIV3|nr:hypothetical protein TVAGG3_0746220 [Trichomonas vaginalis G3]EAY10671.1 hypothetical protein TVAG_157480 [Trichomonas vaginalis G3]KAI5512187.1 hypothetical protein TVAGG3_0746220 [Trichomonas vaginalis G3]|eukprot:XP_001322894.1 hypothetical protein [Trichomonas vaginalis G3]
MSKMIRKMQAKKPVQMTFPTLPNELVKYVWFDPSESEDDNVTFRKMKNSYDEMMKIATEYAKKSFDEMMLSREYEKERPLDFHLYSELEKFTILKKEKYFFKYHHFCGTFYAKASSFANQIANFLVHAIAFQVPTSVDIPGFKNYVTKQFDSNTDAKTDLFRYKSLNAKCQPIFSKSLPKPPSHGDVQSSLDESAVYVNYSIHFCPQTVFDDILYKYFKANNKIEPIQELATTVGDQWQKCIENATQTTIQTPQPSNQPTKRSEKLLNIKEIDDTKNFISPSENRKALVPIDLTQLKRFIDSTVSTFKTSDATRTVIVCAIYRIFFDILYMKYSHLLDDQFISNLFFRNCNTFRTMTPNELEITEGIFTDQQKNQPFVSIDKTVDNFHSAVDCIMSVQFCVNPLDLVNSLFQSMQKFNIIMKRNSLEPKFGQLISVIDEETIAKLQLPTSFDDFFSIFYAAITIEPPSNPMAIKDFLVAFSQLKMDPPMAYAASLFSAGVSHLMSTKKMTFKPQPKDSGNPI